MPRRWRRAGALDVVLLDKTGTLTHGKPEVLAVRTFGPIDEVGLIGMTAALEQRSEHPLAASIVRYAEKDGVTLPNVEDVVNTPGVGVEGVVGGKHVRVGETCRRLATACGGSRRTSGSRSGLGDGRQ